MSNCTLEIIDQLSALIDATPAPPPVDIEPADLLATLTQMMASRTPLFSGLQHAIDHTDPLPPECVALVDRLRERDFRWAGAAAKARHVIAERMTAARRMRRAAR